MSQDGYLRYEPSVEQMQPNEAETIKAVVASIKRTSETSRRDLGRGIRQQHAKAHGFLRGELTVHGNLPDHLRQGMFASARSYPIIVRFSTAFGELRSDRIRRPRGMAIKVLGVSGSRALPEDISTNQDFLLVNHKSYFSDAAAYLWLQRKFELQPSLPDSVLRGIGFLSRGLVKLPKPKGIPLFMATNALGDAGNNILGETYWSQAALRFGDYVARLSAIPISQSLIALSGQPCHDDDDVLLKSVVEYFSRSSAEYELRAQLCTDLEHTPIEDASIDWPEDLAPLQPLARITIPPQKADTPARRIYADEVLSFNPWRCLADHRPLGSLMRLRKEAYQTSSALRHDKRDMAEPQDISEFPD